MKHIAQLLLQYEAVKISLDPPFQWTSGIKSPVYCDNRLLTGIVDARDATVDAFITRMQELDWQPDVIAGVATGSISWAALVAQKMNLPMVFVRPEPKKHGTKKQVEGYITLGATVAIIEDLISTGGSSAKAATALQNEVNADVIGIMAIMCWGVPALEATKKESNVDFRSLTDFTELIPLAAETGYISDDQVETIMQFQKDPATWGGSL